MNSVISFPEPQDEYSLVGKKICVNSFTWVNVFLTAQVLVLDSPCFRLSGDGMMGATPSHFRSEIKHMNYNKIYFFFLDTKICCSHVLY